MARWGLAEHVPVGVHGLTLEYEHKCDYDKPDDVYRRGPVDGFHDRAIDSEDRVVEVENAELGRSNDTSHDDFEGV